MKSQLFEESKLILIKKTVHKNVTLKVFWPFWRLKLIILAIFFFPVPSMGSCDHKTLVLNDYSGLES